MRPAECCTSHMWRHQCDHTCGQAWVVVVQPHPWQRCPFASPLHHLNRGTVLSHSCTDAERSHCPCSGPSAAESSRWPMVPFCGGEAWHYLNMMLPGWREQRSGPGFTGPASLRHSHSLWCVGKTNGPCSPCAHIKALILFQSRGRGHPTIKKYILHVKWKTFRIPGNLEDTLCFF